MTEFTIIVSRPCAALRSNGGHGNKFAINKARKDAKQEARYAVYLASSLPWEEVPDNAIVLVEYTEVLGPRERAMDDDNLIGAMKPYRDGIALALGINDKRMKACSCGPVERGAQGGVRVRVRVWCEVGK